MSFLEIAGLSILFLLTAVPLFAVSYAAFVIVFMDEGLSGWHSRELMWGSENLRFFEDDSDWGTSSDSDD